MTDATAFLSHLKEAGALHLDIQTLIGDAEKLRARYEKDEVGLKSEKFSVEALTLRLRTRQRSLFKRLEKHLGQARGSASDS